MDQLDSKKALLDRIRLLEGANFECDEEAILKEYQTQEENRSSLAITALSIFGGFLASLAFLCFIGMTGLGYPESRLIILGAGFIFTAILMNKEYGKLMGGTFSVSIYITGFAMLAYGLLQTGVDKNIIIVLVGATAFISLIITQNFILPFISTLVISGSFLALIITNDLHNLIHLYVAFYTLILAFFFLNEAKIISSGKKLARLYNPVRIALVISLLFGLVAIGKRFLIPISQNHIWLSSIVMIFVIIYLVYTIIKINEIETVKSKVTIYILSASILVSTIFAPSVSGAIIIILLSFLVNYKTGLAIGVISIIYFVSQYYYDLNFTLLTKSIILFTSGIMFILFYLFTTKKLGSNEKI